MTRFIDLARAARPDELSLGEEVSAMSPGASSRPSGGKA